jgi:tetratricopeptide (TPR) repeat protein
MPCPAESAWIDVAAGASPAGEVEALLAHASSCGDCAQRLADAVALFDEERAIPEEMLAGLVAGNRELASRMAGRRPVAAKWMGWMAVAAGIVVVFGAVWMWRQRSEPPPFELLAKSYGARRPFEMRVDGGAYGPVRVERGAASSANVELLEASADILRRLEQNPDDARLLHAKGLAELMSWRFDAAIQSFQKAASSGLDDAAFWVDFGTAYFQRGEANQDPKDYEKAVEVLSRAIGKREGYAVALFNRGVVYAKLKRNDAAIADLESAIRFESDGAWRREAATLIEDFRGQH